MLKKRSTKPTRRGDTMIEVMFGVAIFGLVAITSIGLMNNGLANSETNLEATMARNEMNAQAEAIRFIHSTYASAGTTYKDLWQTMVGNANFANNNAIKNVPDATDCSDFYDSGIASSNAFAVNTASITNNPSTTIITNLHSAEHNNAPFPYPLVDSSNNAAYGIWVNVIKSKDDLDHPGQPYYYDFYIRSCWYGTGSSVPSSLDTVIRLYNPDRIR